MGMVSSEDSIIIYDYEQLSLLYRESASHSVALWLTMADVTFQESCQVGGLAMGSGNWYIRGIYRTYSTLIIVSQLPVTIHTFFGILDLFSVLVFRESNVQSPRKLHSQYLQICSCRITP